jgi:hypothetical protein
MKVLEAMPVDQFAYRRHERSPSALDLVWTLANEVAACGTMIDSGEVRWARPPAPPPREALRIFHANYEALDERVNRLGDEAWGRPAKLYLERTSRRRVVGIEPRTRGPAFDIT